MKKYSIQCTIVCDKGFDWFRGTGVDWLAISRSISPGQIFRAQLAISRGHLGPAAARAGLGRLERNARVRVCVHVACFPDSPLRPTTLPVLPSYLPPCPFPRLPHGGEGGGGASLLFFVRNACIHVAVRGTTVLRLHASPGERYVDFLSRKSLPQAQSEAGGGPVGGYCELVLAFLCDRFSLLCRPACVF